MKTTFLAGMFATIVVGSSSLATAGGFSTEGVNETGALYNYKSFVIQGSIGYAVPKREYSNGVGTNQLGAAAAGSTSTSASENFFLGDLEMKVGFNKNVDCLLRGHQPYKLRNKVSGDFVGRFEQSEFAIDALGVDATCSYKMEVADGMLVRALGGLRTVNFDAERSNTVIGAAAGAPGGLAALEFNNTYDFQGDTELGWRIGASFEIPEFLLRAQIVYDSEIEADLTGTQTLSNSTATLIDAAPVSTSVTLPQSISARVQSGINETTLAWVGVKWQEWSALNQLSITSPNPALNRVLTTGFDDGWTVTAGVGKRINEDLSIQASLTWNEGIGGGYTDTWSFGAGAAYDLDDNWRVSVGAGATLLTSSNETSNGSGGGASSSAYEQGNDWAYGVGMKLQYALD